MESSNKYLPAGQDPDEVEDMCPDCLHVSRQCVCDDEEFHQDNGDVVCEGSNARKRPMGFVYEDEDDAAQEMVAMGCGEAWDDVISDEPDLYKYFAYFGLTDEEMVRSARTFASFVDRKVQYRKKKAKEAIATVASTSKGTFAKPVTTGRTGKSTASPATSKSRRVDIDLVSE